MTSQELARQEAWYRGNLSWKLHPGQKVINQSFLSVKGQLFVANCSRQWGKSFWAATKAVETALRSPKSQIRYAAAFQSDLMDYIIPTFEKVLEDCPAAIKGRYKTSGTSFVFPNGSRIKLVGLDKNPDGLRGNTLDLIIMDECGFVANLDYIYKSVIIPATTHRPNAKVIMISTPPSTPAHPFVDYCQKAMADESYAVFTIYDNPRIDETTIQRLMKESGGAESTTWQREYLCQFKTDQDLQLIPEWRDEMVQEVETDEYYNYYHKYVGMDLGTKDFTACLFGYYDFKKASLIIQDELHMNGPQMNTLLLQGAIKAKEAQVWAGEPAFRRISDNNNPHLIQDLSSIHNLHFMETNKENLDAMLNEVRLLVQACRLLVHPRCKLLIGCLKFGVWDSKRKMFARSNVYGHYDHLAALVYLVRNLAQHSNPIPATHGFQNHTSWIHNVKNKPTTNGKVLADALLPKKLNRR